MGLRTSPWGIHLLYPLQGALFPDPDVSHDQDAEKDQHLQQPKQAQQLELHRPGEEEDRLHVEYDKQLAEDIEANRVAAAPTENRREAALGGHQLGFERVLGADQR